MSIAEMPGHSEYPEDLGLEAEVVELRTGVPFPNEDETYYPPLENPLETQVIPLKGRIAGGRDRVEGTLEGPVDEEIGNQQPPVVMFQGLFGVESAYADWRHELAQRGLWVATMRPFRGEGLVPALDIRNAMSPVRLASRAALGITREVLARTDQDKVDALTHSNGTQSAIDLALHEELEVVNNVVITAGVGLYVHRFRQMVRRAGQFGRNDFWPSRIRRMSDPNFILEEVAYVFGNPALTSAETYSAGSCHLGERVEQARERGIRIGGILFMLDDFIDAMSVVHDSGHLFDALHIYRDPKAKHTAPQDYPADMAAAYSEVQEDLKQK